MRPFSLYLIIGGGSLATLFLSLTLLALWPGWRWHHEPLHSTLEALGGLAAMAMALVLLQSTEEQVRRKFYPVAGGFLGMGFLEVLHATSTPGNGFVLLRSVASLIGSVGFALVWVRIPDERTVNTTSLFWGIAGVASAFGIWILGFPEQLPVMIREGDFTPTAIAPKSLACMLFFAGTTYFLLDYRNTTRSENVLFASLALMFGLAELMFTYSTIWDGSWWYWHLLRLLAYLLVLGYVGYGYLTTVSNLQNALIQTKQSEGTVRQVLEEREQMAQNLHDGAIQSIFALNLSLERCQRLIPNDPSEAVRKIGHVIADLKLVIRDLRSYLSGQKSGVENEQQLEKALASLIHTMNHSSPIQFCLSVDPNAVHGLTSEEARDLLFIAKEAMSNTLQHAQAQSGVVSLHKRDGILRLEVKDDGRAFATTDHLHPGHGLRNMAARARRLGARFDVRSVPGKGTHITVAIKRDEDHVSA